MGEYMMEGLRSLAASHSRLTHVRGRGLMIGFDIAGDAEGSPGGTEAASAVQSYCRSRGIITQFVQQGRFRVLPPLIVQKPHIDRYIAVLDEALAALARGTIRPRPPSNEYSAAFAARRATGIKAAMQWAWSNSPELWLAKIRGRMKG
jgi:hypothetical protein